MLWKTGEIKISLEHLSGKYQPYFFAGAASVCRGQIMKALSTIECFTEPGKAPIQGEVLKKQEQIYLDMGVTPLLAAPQSVEA